MSSGRSRKTSSNARALASSGRLAAGRRSRPARPSHRAGSASPAGQRCQDRPGRRRCGGRGWLALVPPQVQAIACWSYCVTLARTVGTSTVIGSTGAPTTGAAPHLGQGRRRSSRTGGCARRHHHHRADPLLRRDHPRQDARSLAEHLVVVCAGTWPVRSDTQLGTVARYRVPRPRRGAEVPGGPGVVTFADGGRRPALRPPPAAVNGRPRRGPFNTTNTRSVSAPSGRSEAR